MNNHSIQAVSESLRGDYSGLWQRRHLLDSDIQEPAMPGEEYTPYIPALMEGLIRRITTH